MEVLLETLRLFWVAFVGGVVVAGVLGFLGVHVLLRRIVFVGIALSQGAAAGIAFAFFAQTVALFGPGSVLGLCRNHWTMAALAELLGLGFLLRGGEGLLSREARIGIAWAVAGALSVLFVAPSAQGMEELRNLLTGEVLFLNAHDLLILTATMAPVAALSVLFLGRFFLVAFDRDMALSLGVRAGRWDALCG